MRRSNHLGRSKVLSDWGDHSSEWGAYSYTIERLCICLWFQKKFGSILLLWKGVDRITGSSHSISLYFFVVRKCETLLAVSGKDDPTFKRAYIILPVLISQILCRRRRDMSKKIMCINCSSNDISANIKINCTAQSARECLTSLDSLSLCYL